MQVLSLALLHMVKPLGLSDGVVYANVADKHDKGKDKDKDAEKKIGEKQTSEKTVRELVSVCVNLLGLCKVNKIQKILGNWKCGVEN